MIAAAPHPFFTYSAEVLVWRLGGGQASPLPPTAAPEATAARAARVLRALGARRRIALLGLGSGDLAAALAAALPPDTILDAICLAPETARQALAAGRLSWLAPNSPAQLVADASAQAACQLLWANGLTPENALVTVNPEPADPAEVKGLALVRRLLTAGRRLPDPAPTPARPFLPTLALLARSDEPALGAFFEAARGLASQAVIVWDAPEVPPAAEAAAALDVPVRHLARPLAGDFAAQRNALLAACPSGWVLSLDPDERPGPGFAAAVARIMACPEAGAAYFPRLTLYPDPGRAKVSHGLWPDWQLRLFRTDAVPGPRYVRPLHERLENHPGATVLALDAPILHFNRLLADAAGVAGKLEAFSRVAGAARHHLSADYPTLPLDFFASLAPSGGPGRCLLLPPGL
ncbi:MAG: hypothetical protein B193_1868 [Solidesulfovibrio magneticus str. Maddingley MBC34]|uniref:Glycosyltransferase n=1 Tax=Solidesulfovibrio magneticus str. Maddingley MBC34 TaxID=1206767 RepID=K6HAA3_9BACT|nr:MAG: hypothetical protein B193_1868 [Solidesulfovibrio magneticus str. Maddingley MBC34]